MNKNSAKLLLPCFVAIYSYIYVRKSVEFDSSFTWKSAPFYCHNICTAICNLFMILTLNYVWCDLMSNENAIFFQLKQINLIRSFWGFEKTFGKNLLRLYDNDYT